MINSNLTEEDMRQQLNEIYQKLKEQMNFDFNKFIAEGGSIIYGTAGELDNNESFEKIFKNPYITFDLTREVLSELQYTLNRPISESTEKLIKKEGLRSQLKYNEPYNPNLTLDKMEALFNDISKGYSEKINWVVTIQELQLIQTILKIKGFESKEINQLLNENKILE